MSFILLRVCKFYARGACLKGEQCDFSHDTEDTPVDVPDSFTFTLRSTHICDI